MEDVNKNTELNDTDKKLHISDVSCSNLTLEEYINDFLPWMIKNDYSIHPMIGHKNFNKSSEEIINEFKNRKK